MRFTLFAIGIVLAIGAVAFMSDEATAQTASLGTCTRAITGGNPSGFAGTYITAASKPIPTQDGFPCGPSTYPIENVNAGDAITLRCTNFQTGPVPPLAPNNIEVRFWADNTAYGDPTQSGFFRQVTFSGPSVCDTAGTQTTTISCTNDGTAGGSPRYGIIRISVRIQNGVLYNTHSETSTGDVGIIRCLPSITTFTDGNPSSSPTVYVPGDTLRGSIALNSAPYNTGNTGRFDTICGTTFRQTNVIFTTTTLTQDDILKGSLATIPDDCAVKHAANLNRNSAIPGYTTTLYAGFQTTAIPGVTYSGTLNSVATRDSGKLLDRTITNSACSTKIDGVDRTRGMRAQTWEFSCTWADARGDSIPNNRLATGFNRLCTGSQFDTTDFLSKDFQFDPMSQASGFTVASKTTATDTNSTAGLNYCTDLKTFDTSRVDAQLLHIGHVANRFDIASKYESLVEASKFASPFINSTAGFVIGDDLQYGSIRLTQDTNGIATSGVAVSCSRFKATGVLDETRAWGTTDANGQTATQEYQVNAPPGPWRFDCTGSKDGNTFAYTVSFLHVSPFSSNLNVVILQKVYTNPTTGKVHLNITAQGLYWDTMTANITPAIPDDLNVTMRVQTSRLGNINQDLILWQFPMQFANGPDYLFWANVTVPTQDTWEKGFVAVRMNMSGKPFLQAEQITEKVSSFDIQTTGRLQSMADFFNMPTTIVMPLVFLLALALFTFANASNRINSFFYALLHLMMAFAITATKPQLDEIGPFYAPFAVLLLLGMAILTVVKGWTAPIDPDGTRAVND